MPATELGLWGVRGAIVYVVVPLIVLFVVAALRRRASTLAFSIGTPVAWLIALFLLGVLKPWRYYGSFPWSFVWLDLFVWLPMSLVAGLTWFRMGRWLLSPNRQLQRTRASGASRPSHGPLN